MSTVELESMDEKQRIKNRGRLLAQNKKLNSEIRNLEKEITEIVTARQTDLIRNYEQTNAELGKHREEIAVQQKYIKKLRGQVEFLKSANAKGNAQFIIKEEDELLLLKKEYENLIVQRGVLNKFKEDKLKTLVKDKPFEDHKKSVEENLAAVKKSNKTMQAQITELERQIRKFHNYIVLNNTLSRDKKQTSQLQYEITKSEHEIKQIQTKTREIEDKWKSQLEALDRQLFQLKSNMLKTQARLGEIQKEHRMWEIRKNSLRYEEQIMEFRDRLSKIQLLPQDKLLQNALKSERKKQKLTASEIIKLRKSKRFDEKIESEPAKLQVKEIQQKIESKPKNFHPETQSEQGKSKNPQGLVKDSSSLRKSDKNITTVSEQVKKQKKFPQTKDKEKQKQKQKNIEQKNKATKEPDLKQPPINTKIAADKSKEKNVQQQKSNGKLKKSDQPIRKPIEDSPEKGSPTKNDKKNGGKIETKSQNDNKKQSKKNAPELVKQKSQTKLDTSKQKQKQSPTKKEEKVKSKEQKLPKNQQKSQNKANQITKKSKQSQSPKMAKNQEKKPTKLILKSVGVGTS